MGRFSVKKAKWSIEREEFYKNECFNMALTFKDKLTIENQTVYIQRENDKVIISNPIIEQRFWFETWTKLKSYYNV